MLKTCQSCQELKSDESFGHKGSGVASICQDCYETRRKERQKRDREARRKKAEEIKKDPAKQEEVRAKRRQKYRANHDKELEWRRIGYARHRNKRLSTAKAKRDADLDAYNAKRREERQANLERFRAYDREYSRARRQKDIQYRIVGNLRNRVRLAMEQKSECTKDLLGCSIEHFIAHLESQFKPGMTWENYGSYWSIDHIKPCATYDLADPIQQKECFHWTNCQPLTVVENSSKGNLSRRSSKKANKHVYQEKEVIT